MSYTLVIVLCIINSILKIKLALSLVTLAEKAPAGDIGQRYDMSQIANKEEGQGIWQQMQNQQVAYKIHQGEPESSKNSAERIGFKSQVGASQPITPSPKNQNFQSTPIFPNKLKEEQDPANQQKEQQFVDIDQNTRLQRIVTFGQNQIKPTNQDIGQNKIISFGADQQFTPQDKQQEIEKEVQKEFSQNTLQSNPQRQQSIDLATPDFTINKDSSRVKGKYSQYVAHITKQTNEEMLEIGEMSSIENLTEEQQDKLETSFEKGLV